MASGPTVSPPPKWRAVERPDKLLLAKPKWRVVERPEHLPSRVRGLPAPGMGETEKRLEYIRKYGEEATRSEGFLAGVREEVDPWELVKMAWEEPLRTAYELPGAIAQAQFSQFPKAWGYLKEGGFWEASGHALAGLTPLAGPAAVEVGEEFVTDPKHAFGRMLGLTIPIPVGRATHKLRPAKRPKYPVPFTVGERWQNQAALRLQSVLARSIPSAGQFENIKKRQHSALAGMATGVVESVSEFKGTPEELGRLIQGKISQGRDAVKGLANTEYAELFADVAPTVKRVPTVVQRPVVGPKGPLTSVAGQPLIAPKTVLRKTPLGGVMVPGGSMKLIAIDQYARLKEIEALVPSEALAPIKAQLTGLLKARKFYTVEQFHNAKSMLGEVARRLDELLPGRRAGLNKLLVQTANKAMENALRKAGRGDVWERYQGIQSRYKEMAQALKETTVAKLMDQAPEKVAAFLPKMDLSDIDILKTQLGQANFDMLAARLMRDMVNNAIEGELRHPDLAQRMKRQFGVAFRIEPEFRGRRLENSLERLGKTGHLDRIYGHEVAQNLLAITRVSKEVGMPTGGWMAMLINASVLAPFIKVVSGAGGTGFGISMGSADLMQAGMVYAGVNILARVMVRQPGALSVRNFVRAAAHKNTQQMLFWGKRIERLVEEEMRGEGGRRQPVSARLPQYTPPPLTQSAPPS